MAIKDRITFEGNTYNLDSVHRVAAGAALDKAGISDSGDGLVLQTESITAAGAASTTVPVTLITAGTDGIAITLADGANAGQLKIFTQLHATNEATITPVTTDGAWANAVLTTIGECVQMLWTGTGWALIGRSGGAAQGSATGVVGQPIIG